MAVSAYVSKQAEKVTDKVSNKATQLTQNVSEKATEMTQNVSNVGMAIAEEASVLNPFAQMANSIEQDRIRREANEDADWEQQVQKNGLDPKSIENSKTNSREELLAEMDAQIAAKAEEEKRKNAEFEDDMLNHRKVNGRSYC